jgi:hypothetical protein
MVLYNTATKRMALSHQLEIMQQPLVNRLREGIPFFDDRRKLPGQTKPKDTFAASDLLLAFRAVISEDPYVAAEAEAERLLEDDEFSLSLDKIGDLDELFKVLEWIAKGVHGEMVRVYEGNRDRQFILSNSKTFLLGFAAALGYVRNVSKKHLEGAMEKLITKLRSGADDPLNLDDYVEVQDEITSSRGKTIRTLVYKTFRDYFLSPTLDLDWAETYKLVRT